MGTNGNYSVYWNETALNNYGYTISASNNYMISQAGTFTSTNANYQAVGSPTVEMFVASWNEVYGEQLYCNSADSTGYYFGTTTAPTDTYKDISSLDGYGNILYFPHTSSYNSCSGYWLASPSAYDSNLVLNVFYNGYVGDGYYGRDDCGVRPVVSLKSGIQGTLNGEVWELGGI